MSTTTKVALGVAGLIAAIMLITTTSYTPFQWNTVYYTYWGQYGTPPWTVPWKNFTHVIHVGMEPSTTGPSYYALNGEFEIGYDGRHYQDSLITICHRNGVKVILGMGSQAWNYDPITRTAAQLQQYADSVLAYAKRKGYDGVDVDWEFPDGASTKLQHAALIRYLRSRLDTWTPRGVLTLAVGNGNPAIYVTSALDSCADQINMMNYDLMGYWNAVSGFNSAINKPTDCPSYDGPTVAAGIAAWKSAVHANKLGLGYSWLGYTWNGVDSYCQSPHNGGTRTQPMYTSSQYTNAGAVYHWNADAQCPYKSYNDGTTKWVLFYDDSTSMRAKAKLAHDNGLGGQMWWELWAGLTPAPSIYDYINFAGRLFRDTTGGGIITPPAPDTIKPTVTILNPRMGDTISCSVNLTVTITDNQALDSLIADDNGHTIAAIHVTGQSYTQTYALVTCGASAGVHILGVTAVDSAKNRTFDFVGVFFRSNGTDVHTYCDTLHDTIRISTIKWLHDTLYKRDTLRIKLDSGIDPTLAYMPFNENWNDSAMTLNVRNGAIIKTVGTTSGKLTNYKGIKPKR